MQNAARITSNDPHERSGIETLLMTLLGLAFIAFGAKAGWASNVPGFTQFITLSIGVFLSIVPRRCVSATDRYLDWILATISASGLVLIGFGTSAFAFAQLVGAFAPFPYNP